MIDELIIQILLNCIFFKYDYSEPIRSQNMHVVATGLFQHCMFALSKQYFACKSIIHYNQGFTILNFKTDAEDYIESHTGTN